MGQERFLQTNVLPVELVDRIQRKVRAGCVAVQEDTEQSCVVTVKIYIDADAQGDVDGTYSIEQKFADKKTHEIGKIRDGQLVLFGEGLRSDEALPANWRDDLMALPKR